MRRPNDPAKPVIQANGLNFSFEEREPVLHDLDLQVPQGSIYGFLGPNGAGKTTTLKLILGLLSIKPNPIRIFGMSFAQNYASAS